MSGQTNSEINRRTPSGPCTGSVPSLLTSEDVESIQDEARKTYREYQRSIHGQTVTMYDVWDYHVIMATLKFKEQNVTDEPCGNGDKR